MPFCTNCGTEHDYQASYCSVCGEPIQGTRPESEVPIRSDETDGATKDWNWLDPRGPFRSPRRFLNYFNGIGLLLIIGLLIVSVAGIETHRFIPEPFGIFLVVYMLAVIFLGLPIAGILLITDNVVGFIGNG